MNRVDKLVQFLREHPEYVPHCGIFNSRNTVGDEMENVYRDGDVSMDFCSHWDYIEIFGLTHDEFLEASGKITGLIER